MTHHCLRDVLETKPLSAEVTCRLTLRSPEQSPTLAPALRFLVLEDHSGRIEAVSACPIFRREEPGEVYLGKFRLTVQVATCGEQESLAVLIAEPEPDALACAHALPYSVCPIPAKLQALVKLLNWLKTTALRDFLVTVLNDDSIVTPWLRVPASLHHHHAWVGGLFAHSLECARFAAQAPHVTRETRELATVAALLHDAGKVRTLDDDMRRTDLGHVVDHDELNIEVLAGALVQLDHAWPDGGIALRHLLTPSNRYGNSKYPMSYLKRTVRCADHLSVEFDRDHEAFRAQPDWRNVVVLGEQRRWRIVQPASDRVTLQSQSA